MDIIHCIVLKCMYNALLYMSVCQNSVLSHYENMQIKIKCQKYVCFRHHIKILTYALNYHKIIPRKKKMSAYIIILINLLLFLLISEFTNIKC